MNVVLASQGLPPPKPRWATPGRVSLKSLAYIAAVTPHCLKLDVQLMTLARNLARLKAGRSSAARIAMIAMTTRSSIRVKAAPLERGLRTQQLLIFMLVITALRTFFAQKVFGGTFPAIRTGTGATN